MEVLEDGSEEFLGKLSGILLHPDLGRVEGFFVQVNGFLRTEELFIAAPDIVHWGTRIRVSSSNALSPIEERIRQSELGQDGRTVLGQKILTESGAYLGICRDVQFETVTFRLEWIFPKKFFRFGAGIPASSIIEVKPESIVVRDPLLGTPALAVTETVLSAIAEGPVPRPMDPA